MWHHSNKLIGIMTEYVDDFLCAGTELLYQNVIYKFSVGREETCNFKNLDLDIKSSKYQITVNRFNPKIS